MPDSRVIQRLSLVFLCLGPFVAIALVVLRTLRQSNWHYVLGGFSFGLFVVATWTFARGFRTKLPETRLAAIAGILLILPFSLVSLLWVGLGPPWLASASENQLRYVVLIVMTAAVIGGFVSLKESLVIVGERVYSTLGFAGMILAGPLYLIGEALLLAAYAACIRTGEVPAIFASLSELQDILMFFGGALVYGSTAAFGVSIGHAGLIGRRISYMMASVSLISLVCLVTRGLQFPDPATFSERWYTIPGFVAGIPAVPFVLPYFFGVALLCCSAREKLCKLA